VKIRPHARTGSLIFLAFLPGCGNTHDEKRVFAA
jgi:hypothetical protein